MLTEDIIHLTHAVRSIERGDKETGASYVHKVRTSTRSRHVKRLVYALIDLHNLQPHIAALLKEQKEWREHLAAQQEAQS